MSGMPEHGPRWADIGVNLGDKQFAEDSEQVLARAADSGVALMLLTGTSVPESEAAVALCRQWADAAAPWRAALDERGGGGTGRHD